MPKSTNHANKSEATDADREAARDCLIKLATGDRATIAALLGIDGRAADVIKCRWRDPSIAPIPYVKTVERLKARGLI